MSIRKLRGALKQLADPTVAEQSRYFFKTGKGEYGEGDRFMGIRVPVLRKLVSEFPTLSLEDIHKLMRSRWHEERLVAVLLLVQRFQTGDENVQSAVYQLYLDNTDHVNNWDLVDSSAHLIVGAYLEKRSKKKLHELVLSPSLWDRRIAIIATFHFIRQGQFAETLKISKKLLRDEEDLIHKAVGWMLRETGKRDVAVEKEFLNKHYQKMPRTMLRYAIEKFPEPERKAYLHGLV